MTARCRTLISHALLGLVLASVGLAWTVHEGGESSTEPVLFDEQGEAVDTDVRAGTPDSRLARAAATAPRLVTVAVGDSARNVTTAASTVGDMLTAAGVEVGPDDRVTPSRATPVRAGMTVEVARVEVTERTRTEDVEFDTVERPVDGLADGERQEKQAGQEGLVEIVERVVLVNGEVESRTRVGARVQREPSDRVVLVGAGSQGDGGSSPAEQQPTALASRQSADAPDSSPSESTAAQEPPDEPAPSPPEPAQPAPPEPSPPEPAAQESTGNTQEGEASRYADHFAGDATASGEPYDPNALTAAHRSLPLGTVVTVTNTATGQTVRVRINDRGPYVSGRIIDLSRAAWDRIAPPSAGAVNVRLEW